MAEFRVRVGRARRMGVLKYGCACNCCLASGTEIVNISRTWIVFKKIQFYFQKEEKRTCRKTAFRLYLLMLWHDSDEA